VAALVVINRKRRTGTGDRIGQAIALEVAHRTVTAQAMATRELAIEPEAVIILGPAESETELAVAYRYRVDRTGRILSHNSW